MLLGSLYRLRRVGLLGWLWLASCSSSSTSNNAVDANNAVNLSGCSLSDYTAPLQLGGSQTYNLIVDTGSMAMAVAASTCSNCGMLSPTYKPGSSASTNGTQVVSTYGGSSSWEGQVYTDSVAILANTTTHLRFAAITGQTSNSNTSNSFFSDSVCSGSAVGNTFQGIAGLAPSNLGPAGLDSFTDKLLGQGSLANVFAFQLCENGGRMWLGGYDSSSADAPPQYTPLDFSSGYYLVQMQDIQINGQSIGAAASNYGDTLADTGTSVLIVPTTVLQALSTALQSNAAYVNNFGAHFIESGNVASPALGLSRSALDAQLPPLSLVFPSASGDTTFALELPATSSYLLPILGSDGKTVFYYPGVFGAEPTSGAPKVVLGNSMMHTQIVIFDRQNQQLGFAPQSTCALL